MTRRSPSRSALLLLLALGAGCAGPGAYTWVDDFPVAEGVSQGYVIGPGDVVAVRVFNQEAASARGRVRPDGKISLPFLNDVDAAGYTPAKLALQVQTRLKDFINLPVVTISVEEARLVNISVVGEVARPGSYNLEQGAGVLEAVAVSGGLTDFAHRSRIFVVRRTPAPARIRLTWEQLTRGEGRATSLRLAAGDAVVVE